NTITIRPALDATNINLISNTTIFSFHNTTFTTIDGRSGGIGEEKELSLINTSLNSSTILFLDGSYFNSIMYCNILGSDTSSTDGVVSFKPDNNTNNTLANCLIANYNNNLPSFGIKIFNDYQSGQGGSHQTVINCEIKNFKKAGIEIHIADNSSLIGNIIHNEFEVPSNSLSGINCYARYVTISRCKIYDLISSELNSNEVYGIKIPRAWGGVVDNNFISLAGNEFSTVYGIYLKGELFRDYYFYYNSVNIYGNCENSEGSSCIKRDWTLIENSSLYPPWYLINNIFVNNRVNTSGNGIHLAIDSNDPYYSADYDYNDYYVAPSNNYIGKWINTYASNIEEWRMLSNRDPNSVSKTVYFVSDSDLHLTGGSIGDPQLVATPITSIQVDFDGEERNLFFPYKGADEADSPVTSEEISINLLNFSLSQNYPNPFNPTTKIKYTIPSVETRHASALQMVTLKVYDVLGNEIATLVNEEKLAGEYEVEFTVGQDSSPDIASGIYFYRLTAGDFIQTKKMVLLR
ncbi:MAG: T9SS type A sorting domain-containing protein, partial [Ignavibacteriaceae bacterium]